MAIGFLERKGVAVALIPKCATQSIRRCMASNEYYTPKEARQFDRRVAFVRDPFERLKSGYLFFSWLAEIGSQPRSNPPDTSSYEAYVDWALSTDDGHARPQWDFVSDEDGCVLTDVYLVKDVAEVWVDLFRGMIPDASGFPHAHRMAPEEVDQSYRADDVREYYAKDYLLLDMVK